MLCGLLVQKWTDQAISADLFVKIIGANKVSSTQIIQDYLDIVKYGVKTRYYVNSLTSNGVSVNAEETPVVEEQQQDDDNSLCESCSL